MGKVELKLDGLTITLEGEVVHIDESPQEVEVKPVQPKKEPTEEPTRRQTAIEKALQELIDNGFFSRPKTFNQIAAERNFNHSNLSETLDLFTQQRKLKKRSSSGPVTYYV